MSRTRTGYFLIADITGYTQYLSESELEHAQETLTALLELLVEVTHPETFKLEPVPISCNRKP